MAVVSWNPEILNLEASALVGAKRLFSKTCLPPLLSLAVNMFLRAKQIDSSRFYTNKPLSVISILITLFGIYVLAEMQSLTGSALAKYGETLFQKNKFSEALRKVILISAKIPHLWHVYGHYLN